MLLTLNPPSLLDLSISLVEVVLKMTYFFSLSVSVDYFLLGPLDNLGRPIFFSLYVK